jgi:hypothetical protein
LDEELKKLGVKSVVYVGFMTHMCINSTTRTSFNRGYHNTIIAAATATRPLKNANNSDSSFEERDCVRPNSTCSATSYRMLVLPCYRICLQLSFLLKRIFQTR